MSRFRLNILPWRNQSKPAILLIISVLLLSSACTTFSPPPTTPSTPTTPPPPLNQPPIINSLTAEKEVKTLSETQIICSAADADGDILSYHWSADGGTIKGEDNSITWVAPDTAGNYTVEVTVTDGNGGEATSSKTIAVIDKPNQPPVITSLTRDGNLPDENNRIRQWTTVTIQCNVEDPDGDNLSYLWRATGGKITGEGDAVGWTSPGVNGDYTITAVVTDGRGGSAEASMIFKVLCCGSGF
jgi:hypothetical protein